MEKLLRIRAQREEQPRTLQTSVRSEAKHERSFRKEERNGAANHNSWWARFADYKEPRPMRGGAKEVADLRWLRLLVKWSNKLNTSTTRSLWILEMLRDVGVLVSWSI